MEARAEYISISFKIITCYTCGVMFGTTETYNNSRLEDKKSFYCPNGHQQSYSKSILEVQKEKFNSERKQLEARIEKECDQVRSLHYKLIEKEKQRIKILRDLKKNGIDPKTLKPILIKVTIYLTTLTKRQIRCNC